MSAAQSSAPAAASARAPFKKRPRHFWEGPDPTDEPDEQKQGGAHVVPVARLYRHALESVFGFLELADLSRAPCVSRSWLSAARSMKSINATVVHLQDCAGLIASSLLAKHREDAPAVSLFFGPSLRSLDLHLVCSDQHVAIINDAIVTIGRLPHITDLKIALSEFFPALSFAPLAATAQLQTLTLYLRQDHVNPSLPQLDQLRMLPRLRKMSVAGMGKECLLYLLRTPHALQWQEIHTVAQIDDATSAALSALPSLTKLHASTCRSAAFLPSLTSLRSLFLHSKSDAHLAADIVAGLSCCVELTELSLMNSDVTSKHLSHALSQLPLCKLSVTDGSALESLSFLSECPHLAQSLQSLDLSFCDVALHSTELRHVLTLKSLTALSLVWSFVEPLDACTLHLLQPPSLVLPALTHFSYSR